METRSPFQPSGRINPCAGWDGERTNTEQEDDEKGAKRTAGHGNPRGAIIASGARAPGFGVRDSGFGIRAWVRVLL